MTGIGLIHDLRLSYLNHFVHACEVEILLLLCNITPVTNVFKLLTKQCSKIEHKYAHAVQCRCCMFCCPFKTVQCLLCAKSVWLQCLLCAKSPGVFGFMCSFTPMLLLCGTFNYNMVGACYFSTECNTHICTLRCLYMLLTLVLKEHAQAH